MKTNKRETIEREKRRPVAHVMYIYSFTTLLLFNFFGMVSKDFNMVHIKHGIVTNTRSLVIVRLEF